MKNKSLLDLLPKSQRSRKSKSFRPHGGRIQCEHCGAQTKEYRHKLSKQLGESLILFFEYGKPARLENLGLSYSRRTNFQKLRYFGLVEDDARSGVWTLTEPGRSFVRGEITVPEYVWTWHGTALEPEGRLVSILDLVPDYSTRVSYAEEGRPHEFTVTQESVH